MQCKRKKLFSIRRGLSDIYYIWIEEIRAIFKDRGVIVFFFVVPLLYPLLYSYLYNQELSVESKIAVVDEDCSDLSRTYIRMIDGTSSVEVVHIGTSLDEARELLWRKEAYAVVAIPQGFRKSIYHGGQCEVALFSDLSSILYYKNFMLTLNQAALNLGRTYRIEHLIDNVGEAAKVQVQPIPNSDIALFNPAQGYASFLLPIVLLIIVQQTMLMGVSMLAGTARERNRGHTLFSGRNRRYRRPIPILLGRSLAYMMIYAVVCVWVLCVVPSLFDLPRMAGIVELVAFLFPFLLACTFFSLFVSCFVHNREESMLLLAFTSVIFVFLSGIAWPEVSMPQIWRWISCLIPSSLGARGLVALNSMGCDLRLIPDLQRGLWLQAGGYFMLSAVCYTVMFRKDMMKYRSDGE